MNNILTIFRTILAPKVQALLKVLPDYLPTAHAQAFIVNKKHLPDIPIDSFYLCVKEESITIVALSQEGVRNAEYWYLDHLGYRWFTPSEKWHIKPSLQSVYKPVEHLGIPSFIYRDIWTGYGTGTKNGNDKTELWQQANLLGGLEINAGHAYEAIIKRNKAEFDKHPEYIVNPGSGNPKFDVDNEGLVQLVIADAKYHANLGKPVSMDPSDSGGFKTYASDDPLKKSDTEQTFYLANRVAKEIYPHKVGIYAYYTHSEPPSFPVEPNIIVLVATAMNVSNYTPEQLVNMWKAKGVEVGIRDYMGVMDWDWDMPGKVKGSKIAFVKGLKKWYNMGCRYFNAETDPGFISRGFGHWAAAKVLWNIEADVDALYDEYLTLCFGAAKEIVKPMFDEWQKSSMPIPLQGDLYKWGVLLNEAEKVESDPKVIARITDIKNYFHFINLYREYRLHPDMESKYAEVHYCQRLFGDHVAAANSMKRNLIGTVALPALPPPTKEETENIFTEDMSSYDPEDKTIPADWPMAFAEPVYKSVAAPALLRLRQAHLILLSLSGSSKLIVHTKAQDTFVFVLYKWSGDPDYPGEMVTAIQFTGSKEIDLSEFKGSYLGYINDNKGGFYLSAQGGIDFGVLATPSRNMFSSDRSTFYFRGASEFSAFYSIVVTFYAPDKTKIGELSSSGLTRINLKGEGVWKVAAQKGIFGLQGVFPVVSSSPDYLLKPVYDGQETNIEPEP